MLDLTAIGDAFSLLTSSSIAWVYLIPGLLIGLFFGAMPGISITMAMAIFLPLTLRTRLRLEGAALFMVLSAGSIIISGGIKTILSGGGYGTLAALVQENSGLYEGSTLSTVAIAIIPLTVWVARNGTIFPASRWTMAFAAALCFASLLIPIGTQTRTGLLCIGLLAVLTLRSVKHKFLYMGLGALALLAAIPFLPASYTERMETISDHQADQSASTRLAVWSWTIDYAKEHPLGGGFDAFLGNSFSYTTRVVVDEGGSREVQTQKVTEEARAYHSAYFEMLGEQGWPGLFLWLWLQGLGLWQMERIRRRYRDSEDPQEKSWRGLATALQHGQLIYLLGAGFIGIAYQPFVFMLIGLQIGLATLVARRDASRRENERRERRAARRDAAGRELPPADGALA